MKYSKQRQCIYNYLNSTKSHPTAEQVYDNVSKEIDNISLGTIYRNLEQLTYSGMIIRLKIPGAPDRFDADTTHHYHCVCDKCNKVEDIYIPYMYNIDERVSKETGKKITMHDILFHTLCNECKKL